MLIQNINHFKTKTILLNFGEVGFTIFSLSWVLARRRDEHSCCTELLDCYSNLGTRWKQRTLLYRNVTAIFLQG